MSQGSEESRRTVEETERDVADRLLCLTMDHTAKEAALFLKQMQQEQRRRNAQGEEQEGEKDEEQDFESEKSENLASFSHQLLAILGKDDQSGARVISEKTAKQMFALIGMHLLT